MVLYLIYPALSALSSSPVRLYFVTPFIAVHGAVIGEGLYAGLLHAPRGGREGGIVDRDLFLSV